MRLLDAFKAEEDGITRWHSDTTGHITPDYMVGYSGVLATTLRYARASSAPSQLTLEGFRLTSSQERPDSRERDRSR